MSETDLLFLKFALRFLMICVGLKISFWLMDKN